MLVYCEYCGVQIPKERVECLINVSTCVKCFNETKKIGITIWDKNQPTLLISNESQFQRFNQLEKVDGRLARLK